MNRDNVVRISIFVVIGVAILGIIAVIFSIINSGKERENILDKLAGKKVDIAENCVFDVNLRDFNRLANNVSAIKMCDSYNKLVINDVNLNEKKADLYAIYFNGPLTTGNKNLGIYLNDKLISKGASFDDRNIIRIYDDMLFIKKENIDNTNVVVYDNKGKMKYDFAYALNKIILEDPAFKEDGLRETRVTIDNVNVNSYLFEEGQFMFETISECTSTREYKGSKYKVTYENGKFKKPVFIEKIGC